MKNISKRNGNKKDAIFIFSFWITSEGVKTIFLCIYNEVSIAASQLNIYCNKNLGGGGENPIFHPEEFTFMKFCKMDFFLALNSKCAFIFSVNIMGKIYIFL